ncbi:MAG: tetratricopeptide repeat protein, partial [Phycisphaerae bacterium]|nr:tetratricopeptide repeat protein [Phycisphaerae bacterium]
HGDDSPGSARKSVGGMAATGLLALGLGWGVWQTDRVRRAEAHASAAARSLEQLEGQQWRGEDSDYARLLRACDEAARLSPGDVRRAYERGLARYFAAVRDRDPRDVGRAALVPALQEFERAMRLCPTFGASYSMAGQITAWLGDLPRAERLLARATALSPHDGPTAQFRGELALHRGEDAVALELFRRALATASVSSDHIIRRIVSAHRRPDLALRLAGEDRLMLQSVVRELREARFSSDADAAERKLQELMLAAAEDPAATPSDLYDAAQVLRRRGDLSAAAEYLRRAIARSPNQLAWRFELATVLSGLDQPQEALREVNVVLRDRPDWPGAHALRAELSRRAAPIPASLSAQPR